MSNHESLRHVRLDVENRTCIQQDAGQTRVCDCRPQLQAVDVARRCVETHYFEGVLVNGQLKVPAILNCKQGTRTFRLIGKP